MNTAVNDKKKISRSDFARDGLRYFSKILVKVDDKIDAIQNIVNSTLNINKHVPLLRPPGAIDEESFLSVCTGCNDCINACSYGAIIKAESTDDVSNDTPVINPAENPCRMCEDFSCISACSTGALVHNRELIKMGSAFIVKNKCYAFNGQVCDYCYDRCPEKGKAVIMDENKPVIISKKCTGCGICEYYCPAPGKGVTVIPIIKKTEY